MSDGRVLEGQPDRYILKCVSGEEFTKELGFANSTVLEFKVDQEVYDSVVAYSPVVVKYNLSNFGTIPVSVESKTNK